VVTTLAVGHTPPQIVVTYNSSVYTTSVQDIVNYALTLVVSLLNAPHNDAQMLCNSLRFVLKLAVDELRRIVLPPERRAIVVGASRAAWSGDLCPADAVAVPSGHSG
jgi:hypothetical protein